MVQWLQVAEQLGNQAGQRCSEETVKRGKDEKERLQGIAGVQIARQERFKSQGVLPRKPTFKCKFPLPSSESDAWLHLEPRLQFIWAYSEKSQVGPCCVACVTLLLSGLNMFQHGFSTLHVKVWKLEPPC